MVAAGDSPTGIAPAADDAALARGRWLFAQPCTFVRGVASLDGLPEAGPPEIAFAGRSNCGKSSLLNALTGRRTLARTSNTPGRTRQLNFFDLGGQLWLVDMPGYGYARAAKSEISAWTAMVRDYLRGRPSLRRVCVLIDARHGIKANDREMLDMLDAAAVSVQIVLTKIDKLKAAGLAARIDATIQELKAHPAALPEPIATSARAGSGIDTFRASLATLAAAGTDALKSAPERAGPRE